MFAISGSHALEIVARVSIVYIGLLVLMRLSGRRTLSDVTPLDIMVMLLVSETVSPALTPNDNSLTGGLIAAATLMIASAASSHLAFRSRRAEVLLSGATDLLIRDGKVDGAVKRRYRITDEDLECALHHNGLLQVTAVARGFVEADGNITIVRQKDVDDGAA